VGQQFLDAVERLFFHLLRTFGGQMILAYYIALSRARRRDTLWQAEGAVD